MPTRMRLVINLKAAKAIDLDITELTARQTLAPLRVKLSRLFWGRFALVKMIKFGMQI
jgi:hypothetical protein